MPLNCAGLVETILESELFGHEKGSFTGAVRSRVGLFEYANHGTVFLDEIGDMPVSSQTKLLRVLEHGEIVRVGSNEPVHVDVRLIAATHQDLRAKMKDGSFRQDLFYRLNVVSINLPPLRERHGDIALLVDSFVRQLHRTLRQARPGPDPCRAQGALPLRLARQRARAAQLHRAHGRGHHGRPSRRGRPARLHAGADRRRSAGRGHPGRLAGQSLEKIEREHIAQTLDLVDGNREKAAELLGIGERTLYRKIEKYGLR